MKFIRGMGTHLVLQCPSWKGTNIEGAGTGDGMCCEARDGDSRVQRVIPYRLDPPSQDLWATSISPSPPGGKQVLLKLSRFLSTSNRIAS